MNHYLGGKADGKTEEKRKVIHRMNEMGISIELIASAALSAVEVINHLSQRILNPDSSQIISNGVHYEVNLF